MSWWLQASVPAAGGLGTFEVAVLDRSIACTAICLSVRSERHTLLAIRRLRSYGTKYVGSRRYRRQEESLRARVQEHRAKIEEERGKSHPAEGLIAYWQREIQAFETGIARAQRRQRRRR
jgi:hypothetical protein